jgi:type II secretory pathway component GspD/PulD (secretin)
LGLPAAAAALLALHCAPSAAQGAAYCNITRITTQRLANAVQVTIQADGAMAVQAKMTDFFNMDAMQTGSYADIAKRVTSLPFTITNARSKVSSFTDIGIYPVSHVEASAIPDAPEGIGVALRVALLTPVTVESVQTLDGIDLTDPWRTGAIANVQMTPDRMSLIVMVIADRQTMPTPQLRAAPPGAPVELSVSAENGRVSIHALNADLKDLLRRMAAAAGTDIVLDGSTGHTVSLCLDGVPFRDALDGIEEAYGLIEGRTGSAIRLSDADVRSLPSFEQSATELVPLHNTTASAARDSLPEFLLHYVAADTMHNSLAISGPPYLIEKLRADVAALDRPSQRVEVSAEAVEVSSTDDLDVLLGADARDRGHQLSVQADTGDITFRSLDSPPAAIDARLESLEATGRARLVSKPHATALLGDTANLFVGIQKLVKVTRFDSMAGEWVTEIIEVDVGSNLVVKPLMIGEQGITVHVEPSVSTISEVEPVTGLPTVFTRNASTTMRVRDGDTVVVGGLGMEQQERSGRSIPFLRNLPLIGGLFRLPSHSRPHSELIYLLKVHVV